MKKIGIIAVLLICIVLATLGLSACSRGSDDLIIWWPSGKVMEIIINQAVAEYQKTHPDFKVEIVYKPIDAFDAYRYALNDPKTCPDIAILDHVYVQALAYDGLLMNLSAAGSDEIANLYPSALYNANCYEGSAYALPFSANTVVLMYNKDILKACGIVDEAGNAKAPTTMSELLEACAVIESKGYTAFAQPQNSFSAMEFMSYVSRHGGKVVSDDYRTVLLNSPEVKAAVEDWKALSEYANSNAYEEDKFYTGKVAFVEMGSWAISKVSGSSSRFDCGFAEMVTIENDLPNYSGLGLYSLCIAASSEKSQEAYEFAKFLSTDKTVQLAYNQEQNLFPVTNEALEDPYYTDSPILSVYAAQLQKVTPRPGTPVWPDLEQAIVNMLVEVVRTDGDYTSILNKYQQNVQQATDRLFG